MPDPKNENKVELTVVTEKLEESAKNQTIETSDPDSDLSNVVSSVDTSDLFVTENDTFDVTVKYYKQNGEIIVEDVDEAFDLKEPTLKEFSITFKYPSQGDFEAIMARNAYKSPDQLKLIDVLQMELTRLVILIRKWTINAEFSRMIELDPKVIKGISVKVREKIGMRGIL